jgi:hypothetical protein
VAPCRSCEDRRLGGRLPSIFRVEKSASEEECGVTRYKILPYPSVSTPSFHVPAFAPSVRRPLFEAALVVEIAWRPVSFGAFCCMLHARPLRAVSVPHTTRTVAHRFLLTCATLRDMKTGLGRRGLLCAPGDRRQWQQDPVTLERWRDLHPDGTTTYAKPFPADNVLMTMLPPPFSTLRSSSACSHVTEVPP